MRIEKFALFAAVLIAIVYVVAMIMGVLSLKSYGLIGLILPFILGYLYYRVLRPPKTDESEGEDGAEQLPKG